MSFGKVDPDAFKKYLNKMATGCRCSGCKPKACQPAKKSCSCDSDSECKDCACKDKKKKSKPITQTVQDDGCFCRKCNSFLPMVEPDDKGDGKTLCYNCAHPW